MLSLSSVLTTAPPLLTSLNASLLMHKVLQKRSPLLRWTVFEKRSSSAHVTAPGSCRGRTLHQGFDDIQHFLATTAGVDLETINSHTYAEHDDAAAHHLFGGCRARLNGAWRRRSTRSSGCREIAQAEGQHVQLLTCHSAIARNRKTPHRD